MSAKKNTSGSQELSNDIINTVREPLIVLNQDFRVITASRSFYDIFKVNSKETEGQLIYNLGNKQWDIPKLRELLETILPQKTTFDDYEMEHDFPTIGKRIMLLNARQIHRVLGKKHIILLSIEDITERRLAEEKLLLAAIVESSNDAIISKSLDGIITSWNKGAEEIYGYTKNEMIGKSISVLIPPELPDEMTEILRKIKLGEWIKNYETVRRRKDGQNIDVSITGSSIHDAEGMILGASTMARDITERKRLEILLSDSEEQYRLLFETANDGIVLIEKNEGEIAHINPSVEKMLGYSAKESIGNKLQEIGLIIDNGDFQITMKNLNERGILRYNEVPVKTKSGQQIYTDTYLVDKAKFAQCNIRDITDRKHAEESLRQSEEQYRTILEEIQEGYFEVDLVGNVTFFNNSLCRILGYSKEELMGMNYRQYTDKEHSKELFQTFNKVYNTREPSEGFDWQIIRKDGIKRYVEASVSLQKDSSGRPIGFRGIARDITERKQTEEAQRRSEKNFRHSLDDSPLGVRISTIEGETIYANRTILDIYGYDSIEELKNTPLKERYTPESYAEYQMRKEKRLRGEFGPSEYEISIVRKNGEIRHLHVFRKEIFWNGTKQSQVMYQDITERKQTDEKLHKTLDNLKKAIGTTIQVMISAIEVRDPCTSGHQTRSADLARAIAKDMGLSQEKIEGIRIAGSIHDIGKLSIPAELLSKPTKLTNIEFSLIKEHSLIGYELLKDVESPWPLAQIVYQHHERMDGSGYPRNLKGDEIIIEARIMAVADVVEAMASHRPYRPSLGIDAALAEIEKNKGICYDNTVADACLRLFREKGYKLLA